MKKFLCVFLSLLMLFSFAACGKEKDKKDSDTVDIEYFVKLGKLPECEFKIGTDHKEIEEKLSQANPEDDDHDHETYQIVEGKKSVLIDAGAYCYYYLKEKKEEGISYIVSYESAFGFDLGTVSTEIEKALGDIEYNSGKVDKEKAFFVFSEDATAIECTISKYTLMFIFENDALCATAIYLTKDWQ